MQLKRCARLYLNRTKRIYISYCSVSRSNGQNFAMKTQTGQSTLRIMKIAVYLYSRCSLFQTYLYILSESYSAFHKSRPEPRHPGQHKQGSMNSNRYLLEAGHRAVRYRSFLLPLLVFGSCIKETKLFLRHLELYLPVTGCSGALAG